MNVSVIIDKPRPKWRRLLGAGLACILLLGGIIALMVRFSGTRLEEARAEADRLDPGWRLSELEARQEPIPDPENSALVVIASSGKIPGLWPAWDRYQSQPAEVLLRPAEAVLQAPPDLVAGGAEVAVAEAAAEAFGVAKNLSEIRPNVRYTTEEATRIRHELLRAQAALELARTLASKPRGRHPITISPDWVSTLLPTVQGTRDVGYLLNWDVNLRAHEGDFDGALESCRALLNSGRSLNDAPFLIGQLVRIGLQHLVVTRLERVLAQGIPDPKALAILQKCLSEEAEEPLMLIGLRGERAGMDQFFQAIQDGKVKWSQVQGLLRGGFWVKPSGTYQKGLDFAMMNTPGIMTRSRAAMLHRMNEVVEIAKLPPEAQHQRLLAWEKEDNKTLPIVRELSPAVNSFHLASCRGRGLLRAAATALGAERFRQVVGHWPQRLEELVPDYVTTIPLDPFDGQPLRYRLDPEGVVIYLTGSDRKDDGGSFETLNIFKPGTDVGFRMWHPSRRGVEPPPPP